MSEEEKVPKIGDTVLTVDAEGDPRDLNITEVDTFDADNGLWTVSAGDDEYNVYWSDEDKSWVDSEAEFD